MKTSVVLLALATAAIAAPALHEEAFGDEQTSLKQLDNITRERKSQELGASPSPGTPVSLPSSQISEFGVSGRSFNLKKPIIIKKRVGSSYQVYRDSDEEKLDSPEPCRKQEVKVKLCEEHYDAKSGDMMKSSTMEDPHLHMDEDDMKHSIKLAKEAVENIQKDLKKIEHKPGQTMHLGDSESDVELHQDIEVARQALEHIHNNFGMLETPSLHDMTLKEAEIVEDVAFPLAQTEEERLAQWKEAIENIQRNVEIVKNIEDSFKSTQDELHHTDEAATSIKDINKNEPKKLVTKDTRTTENSEMKEEHLPTIEKLNNHEKSSDHEMRMEPAHKDMLESASMVSASKLQELNVKDKSSDAKHADDTMNQHHLSQNMGAMALKAIDEEKERKTATEDKHFEKTEKHEIEPSMKKMKSMDSESLLELQRNAAKELHGTSTHMPFNEGQVEHIENTKDMEIEMKSADHIAEKKNEMMKQEENKHEKERMMEQPKDASAIGHLSELKEDASLLGVTKTHENMMHMGHSLSEGKKALNENSMMPAMTTDPLALDQHRMMMSPTFEMKAAEDIKSMQHQLTDPSHMRWAQDKNFNTEMGLMKSAAETLPDHMHKHSHHHAHQHAMAPHHMDSTHARMHDHFMTHGPSGKSADMDNAMQSNYFMNMRDSDNLGQEGHRFRWRPSHHTHEAARSAYGAPTPSAPATGAVGLFPNANVGGCGIPLLLSCNPSVVSGSLAKARPASYSAPAYRSEDDINFHSKRDVKKTETFLNTLNRTPENHNLKTSPTLVAKQ